MKKSREKKLWAYLNVAISECSFLNTSKLKNLQGKEAIEDTNLRSISNPDHNIFYGSADGEMEKSINNVLGLEPVVLNTKIKYNSHGRGNS